MLFSLWQAMTQDEHPTQALLDAFTIRREKKTLDNLVVTIVGDIAHSRVARSDILALTKLGANVRVAAPGTMLPPAEIERAIKRSPQMRQRFL